MKLTLQYDGTDFRGWQVQQTGVRTVQHELEKVLQRLTQREVRVAAAGRTDTGVHATGQVVSVDVPERWTPESLEQGLNALLPRDVWVAGVEHAADDFHARFSATARAYEYRIGTVREAFGPFHGRVCWPLRDPLDRLLLGRCAEALHGEHSFRAFAKAGQEHRGDRCVVHEAGWVDWAPLGLAFRIRANRFLHHMVRYLVSTMVDVARGRRPFSDMEALLEGREGVTMSRPAPPQGLFLAAVGYGDEG